MRLPSRNRLLLAGALSAAGVAIALALAGRSGDGATPRYETTPVGRGRVASIVTANGTVSPTVTVQVGSQISGRILSLHADFNSRVKKGDLVARIDPALIESQLAQSRAGESVARAAVTGAEAGLAEARRQHDRVAELLAKGLASGAEADTSRAALQAAEAELASAKARVEQARAQRVQAETSLAYTRIVSPIDGTVISRDVDVGQTVAASLQAPTLFTIAEDLRRMELHTSVAEADVGRLRASMPVEFTVDAFPGERFGGVVREVRFAPKTVQNVVTYDAVVTVDNSALKLRPGMTATVTFIVEEVQDTLLVPNAALRFRPPEDVLAKARERRGGDGVPGRVSRKEGGPVDAADGGQATQGTGARARPGPGGEGPRREGERRMRPVWLVGKGGALEPRFVQVGPSDGKNTAVSGGDLSEGDAVVTGEAGARDGRSGGAGAPGGGPARPGFGRFL